MTQAQTLTLADFLLARIAEDEAVARITPSADQWIYTELGTTDPGNNFGPLPQGMGEHMVRWQPRRVRAECEAKRRIIADHTEAALFDDCLRCRDSQSDEGRNQAWPCVTMRALAAPYSDHPDYRDEWRP